VIISKEHGMELNVLCCLFPWHLYDDKLVLKDEKAPIINDQLQDYKE
ncbi:16232_t:CDS:1, partial [Gigaspora rosea]